MNNNQDQVCEHCDKTIRYISDGDYYFHDLPDGDTYEQQKARYPKCWNRPKPKPTPDPTYVQCRTCLRRIVDGGRCINGSTCIPCVTPDPLPMTDFDKNYEYVAADPKVEQVAKRPEARKIALVDPEDVRHIKTFELVLKSEADALFDSQDAKIASLEKELSRAEKDFERVLVKQREALSAVEKELRVYKRALEMAARDLDAINRSYGMMPIIPEMYLEAARKEQNGE